MKKGFLIIIFLYITPILQAQVYPVFKSVNITAGGLYSALTYNERLVVTDLTVNGIIDARDFLTLRDEMHSLKVLDLTGTSIASFTGWGPAKTRDYPANTIPINGLMEKFGDYSHLKSVLLPSSVTSIDSYAFQACTSLLTFNVPSSVTTICAWAFWSCSSLTSVNIPSSVTTIGEYAFWSCSSLSSVDIPSSVTSIGSDAFRSTGIKSVSIPSSITSIEARTFLGCNHLTSLTIPLSIDSIGIDAFRDCSGLTSLKIPSSVTYIGGNAFLGCSGLTSVTISSSITSMSFFPFVDCVGLKAIYADSKIPFVFTPNSTEPSFDWTFSCKLYVPIGSISAYKTAYVWRRFYNVQEFVPTEVKFSKNEKISLYPNPITDGFRIMGINAASELRLYDINGKLILVKKINNNQFISLRSYPKGIYLIKVISSGFVLERKVMVE